MNDPATKFPRVGVGVIVVRQSLVLLGRRLNPPQAGCWQLPGGKLEWGESPEETAARETFEECGLRIHEPRCVGFTNSIFLDTAQHYVTLFVAARSGEGAPQVREPEKCADWRWLAWTDFPTDLFLPLAQLRAQKIDLAQVIKELSVPPRYS